MSKQATLMVEPCATLGPGGRRIEVDCQHGLTTVHTAPPADLPAAVLTVDQLVLVAVRMVVAKHHVLEGCRCTRRLRRRFLGAT